MEPASCGTTALQRRGQLPALPGGHDVRRVVRGHVVHALRLRRRRDVQRDRQAELRAGHVHLGWLRASLTGRHEQARRRQHARERRLFGRPARLSKTAGTARRLALPAVPSLRRRRAHRRRGMRRPNVGMGCGRLPARAGLRLRSAIGRRSRELPPDGVRRRDEGRLGGLRRQQHHRRRRLLGRLHFRARLPDGHLHVALRRRHQARARSVRRRQHRTATGARTTARSEMGFTCDRRSATPPAQLNLAVTYRDFNSFPIGTRNTTSGLRVVWGERHHDPRPRAHDARRRRASRKWTGAASSTGTAGCPYGQELSTAANFDGVVPRRRPTSTSPCPARSLLAAAGERRVRLSTRRTAGFYPIDGRGFTAAPVDREPRAVGRPRVNDGRAHNFGFTTELRYFFQYSRRRDADLQRRRRPVGVHQPPARARRRRPSHPRRAHADVDTSAAALGLTMGGLYEIVLFHAERHSAGSNFKLTLTGFAPTHSTCRADLRRRHRRDDASSTMRRTCTRCSTPTSARS